MSTPREPSERAGTSDRWSVFVVVLVVLALIASIIMLVTDSEAALKLALIAALWAAVIGFFLVYRYRKQAEEARAQQRHELEMHTVELEHAKASAQATAPAQNKQALPEFKLRDEDMQVLADIRTSLADLRTQLEELSGYAFGTEPEALRAHAWRMEELENRADGVAGQYTHPEKPGDIAGAPSWDAVAGTLGSTDQHGRISPELAQLLEEQDQQPEPEEAAGRHEAAAEPEDDADTDAVYVDEVAAEPEPEPEHEPEDDEDEGRGARRVEDGGISVAELMARMKKRSS